MSATKNYIKNRVEEDFIIKELAQVRSEFVNALDSFKSEALLPLTEQIKLHLEVQRETLKTQKCMQKTLKSLKGEVKSLAREKKVKQLLKDYGW